LASQPAALEKELKQRLDVHEAAIVTILQWVMDFIDPPALPPPPSKPRIGFRPLILIESWLDHASTSLRVAEDVDRILFELYGVAAKHVSFTVINVQDHPAVSDFKTDVANLDLFNDFAVGSVVYHLKASGEHGYASCRTLAAVAIRA
jgi:hypothetical protein